MRVLFYEKNIDRDVGSHRIYMHHLRHWIQEIGHNTAFNLDDFSDYDIIICGKSVQLEKLAQIREATNALIGIANSTNEKICFFDFCIAANQTERSYSIQFNQNIIIFPQIESITGRKIHSPTDTIRLCYHGNRMHLEQMSDALINALESFVKRHPFSLKAIYNVNRLGQWTNRRPQIPIEDVQWQYETLADEVLECDIGLVPALSPISKYERKAFFFLQRLTKGSTAGFHNDLLVRMKVTTNAGRAFIFHQLGLPVISELIPDASHILQSPQCGYVATNHLSWLNALERLSNDYQHRETVAANAHTEFCRLYDPLVWARLLMEELRKLYAAKHDT